MVPSLACSHPAILGMEGRAGQKGWQWNFILVCNCLHSSPHLSHRYRWQRTDEMRIRRRGFLLWHLDLCLLHSTTDSDVIPISYWKRERRYPLRLSARLDARLGRRGFLAEAGYRCIHNPPRECYAVVFLGLLELTGCFII